MRLADRMRRGFLRWSRVGLAALFVAPFAVASALGFLWLFERGWLIAFVAIFAALAAVVWGARAFLVRRARRVAARAASDAATARPEPRRLAPLAVDPDWTPGEVAVYEEVRAQIEARLAAPMPWEELPAEALSVIERVATGMSGGRRGALDFTVPEALLLADRVATRYRDFLRAHVPFSDQVSVRTIHWIWERRETARAAWEAGFLAYRGVRLALNPPVGLLRELERLATAGLQDRLTEHLMRDAQAILLEEVAQAAIDLYSGRLRFSDRELVEIELGSELRDRASLARPDDPVRVLVIGQISAGKSTLINALLGEVRAETDLAPTTDRATAYDAEIDGIPCRFVDTMGLDGSARTQSALLAEMLEADMVIWALRATRPSRAVDDALRRAFEARFAGEPARRKPPSILVASAADTLLPAWPYPENRLPPEAQTRMGEAVAAIGADMGGVPIPICAEPPVWNLDTLHAAIAASLGEALMTQRNRRRLSGEGGLRLDANLGRAGRGVAAGARVFGERFLRRLR